MQVTDTLVMIRPANFCFNAETADSNAFQSKESDLDADSIRSKAVEEFDAFVATLRNVGVKVLVVQDSASPIKPDAVFPNNWVSFHQNGQVFLYPMAAKVRRLERRPEILDELSKHFILTERVDLSYHEAENRFLEGTGSMIFDRDNKLAYACLGPRTDEFVFDEFCNIIGYEKVVFRAVDASGKDIYHTNVMMAIAESFVIICMDSVQGEKEKQILKLRFQQTHKEVIDISFDQMNQFAGNMLQVKSSMDEKRYLVMSEQAYRSLTQEQIDKINAHTNILRADLYTIEKFGGGSARCMLAEMFLPLK